MKKQAVTFILFLFAIHAAAQNYYVARVIGQVYTKDQVPVKKGDMLEAISNLKSADPGALLRVDDPKKGSTVVSFQNGKKGKVIINGQPSEFYQLVLQDYIDKWGTYKSAGTKGKQSYDWFDCFTAASADTVNKKVLVIAGEKTPLLTHNFNPAEPYRLLVYSYPQDKDSLVKEVPIQGGFLYFDRNCFPAESDSWLRLKIRGITAGSGQPLPLTDNLVRVSVRSRANAEAMLRNYRSLLDDKKSTTDQLKKEMSDFVFYNYGYHFDPWIDELINRLSKGE